MTSLGSIDESAMPTEFRSGLAHVRARVLPSATAVADDGNFIIVSVGTMTKTRADEDARAPGDAELPDVYVQSSVQLFARVSRCFPNGNSYGVITVPFLQRADGQPLPHQQLNNANAQFVATALGRTDVGFWSWDWRGMPSRNGQDLVAIVEWARKCVREGAR